jgi:hypothetical protein
MIDDVQAGQTSSRRLMLTVGFNQQQSPSAAMQLPAGPVWLVENTKATHLGPYAQIHRRTRPQAKAAINRHKKCISHFADSSSEQFWWKLNCGRMQGKSKQEAE